jgi:hypothetical protein
MTCKKMVVFVLAMKPCGGKTEVKLHLFLIPALSSFGGLEVACWPLVSKFKVGHPRCVELKLLCVRSAVNHNYMYCVLCGGIHSEYLL